MKQEIFRKLGNMTFYRGRVALYAILRALGIGTGENVAIQAFTCVAVPEGVMASGAKSIYIDIEKQGFNMDSEDLERKITPNTKALIVQHTFGIPANMASLMSVAKRFNLFVIEDCCHTLFSQYKGKVVGSFGVGSFYSFEWGKPLVVGVGGALQANDQNLYKCLMQQYVNFKEPSFISNSRARIQYLSYKLLYRPRLYWQVRSVFHALGKIGVAESNYNTVEPGKTPEDFSLKMSAVCKKKLKKNNKIVEKVTCHSKWVAGEYAEKIRSPQVLHPPISNDSVTIFCRYPLIVTNKKELLAKAKRANVELAEWYATPVHPLTGRDLELVGYQKGSCVNAEKMANKVVSLPTNLKVGERDIERAVNFINNLS